MKNIKAKTVLNGFVEIVSESKLKPIKLLFDQEKSSTRSSCKNG